MFIEPSAAVETAIALYENRRSLLKLTARLQRILTHGKTQIVIFGPGGVGKSTLGTLLTKGIHYRIGAPAYTESVHLERYALEGDLVCEVLVPPGQERWRGTTWPELYREMSKGKIAGVINVASWGHHSLEALQGYRDTKFYHPPMTQEQFVHGYLEDRRALELQIVKDILPRLQDADGKLWMLTLVTKQDLWWKHRHEVKLHYSEGAYNAVIEEATRHRGVHNFTHQYLSASLVISNFVSGTGELLVPTTEGYDQNIQMSNLRCLLETVQKLVEN